MPDIDMTWSQLAAMRNSHNWRVMPNVDTGKACRRCGDQSTSLIRYCPGKVTTGSAAQAQFLPPPPPLVSTAAGPVQDPMI